MNLFDTKNFFNELASSWDQNTPNKEEKIETILNLICLKHNAKILDVGTGTGVLIPYLRRFNPKKIVAIDIANKMIEEAQLKFKADNVEFKISDIYDLKDNNFDYVFMYQVYPHLENKQKLVEKIGDLLKPYGRFVIAHSDSKEKVNKRHKDGKVKNISNGLKSALKEAVLFKDNFCIDILVDTDEYFIISGIKK